MIICPNCYSEVSGITHGSGCRSCSWTVSVREGLPVFFSDKDMADPLFNDYSENYEQIAHDDLENSILDESYLNVQRDKMLSYMGNIRGKACCEVGVGQGFLLKEVIRQDPSSFIGIDISGEYLKVLQEQVGGNYALILANAENIPFKDHFDLLYSSDVLEHVINVGNFLLSCNRALKVNGRFIVRVPYDENINSYSNLYENNYKYIHLRNFDAKTLRTVLEGAGFKVNKIIYDGFLKYKMRLYSKNLWLDRKIEFILEKLFGKQSGPYYFKELASLNEIIGRLLFKPCELVADCEKITDIAP